MQVCIVDTVAHLKNGRGWQVMRRINCGLAHVERELLTLEEAITYCNENNYKVIAVGDFWQCVE